ncbi:MAG: RNA-binding protein [Arenicellales bacterium]
MKLLARNLARTTTEAELKALFEAYGKVQYCSLATDKNTGSSKGFAFIEMPRPGDAKAAVKNLNGKDVAGKKIRVKKAETKKPGQANEKQELSEHKATEAEIAAPENIQPEQDESQTTKSRKSESKPDAPINPGIWSK